MSHKENLSNRTLGQGDVFIANGNEVLDSIEALLGAMATDCPGSRRKA